MATNKRPSITGKDRELLTFLAEHRTAVISQLAALLKVTERTAAGRVNKLVELGYARSDSTFTGLSPWVLITRPGLRLINRELPAPKHGLAQYRHDVGLGWLWLAARDGAFGQVDKIISEREMRSHDGRPGNENAAHGVGVWRVSGRGPGSDRHYPDLQLQTASGHRVAVELELSGKSDKRLDEIMFAYAIDRRYQRVLYIVPDQQLGERIRRAARRAGIPDMVRVQQLTPDGIAGAPQAPTSQRSTDTARSPVATPTRGAVRSAASRSRSVGAEAGR